MLRLLFWSGLLVVIWLLARERIAAVKRRMRGEPPPTQRGPRTITRVLIVIGVVYVVLIGYRLLVGDGAV